MAEGPVYILYPSEEDVSVLKEHGLDPVPIEGGSLYELLPMNGLGG